jgi:hypothetical protein
MVGATGFEPVTSSVSARSRHAWRMWKPGLSRERRWRLRRPRARVVVLPSQVALGAHGVSHPPLLPLAASLGTRLHTGRVAAARPCVLVASAYLVSGGFSLAGRSPSHGSRCHAAPVAERRRRRARAGRTGGARSPLPAPRRPRRRRAPGSATAGRRCVARRCRRRSAPATASSPRSAGPPRSSQNPWSSPSFHSCAGSACWRAQATAGSTTAHASAKRLACASAAANRSACSGSPGTSLLEQRAAASAHTARASCVACLHDHPLIVLVPAQQGDPSDRRTTRTRIASAQPADLRQALQSRM